MKQRTFFQLRAQKAQLLPWQNPGSDNRGKMTPLSKRRDHA